MDVTRHFEASSEEPALYPEEGPIFEPADTARELSPTASLGTILAAAEADPDLPATRLRDIRSALNSAARHQKCALTAIPATPEAIDVVMAAMRSSPQAYRADRIANITSLIRRAVARYAPAVESRPTRPSRSALSPAWTALLTLLPNTYDSFGLVRFGAWASDCHVDPSDICPEHFDRFGATALGGVRHPHLLLRRLAKTWNRASKAIPAWPDVQLPVPWKPSKVYRASAAEIAPSLQAELDAYFAERTRNEGKVALSFDGPTMPGLRESSAKAGMRLVWRYLGAVEVTEQDLSDVRSLADLVQRNRVLTALKWLSSRADNRASSQLSNIMGTLASIARYAVRDEALAKEISQWRAKVTPKYRGMVDQRRERLMATGDPAVLRCLLGLPRQLMDSAIRGHGKAALRDAQLAVALDLLIHTALRIGNIAGLHIDRNVQTVAGASRRTVIVLRPEEVKNREERAIPLPDAASKLLEFYLREFRPALSGAENRFLFPGRSNRSKSSGALGQQISKVIREQVGIEWTPHLFRALTVRMYREKKPGDTYGAMRILGDRNLKTFTGHYAFLDTAEAYADLHACITASRSPSKASLGRGQRRTSR
jgi:integrase